METKILKLLLFEMTKFSLKDFMKKKEKTILQMRVDYKEFIFILFNLESQKYIRTKDS